MRVTFATICCAALLAIAVTEPPSSFNGYPASNGANGYPGRNGGNGNSGNGGNGYSGGNDNTLFQGYSSDGGYEESPEQRELAALSENLPGTPGQDYPIYSEVPETGFKCENQDLPGYYADPETQCQGFHICQEGGRMDSFLCPNGTIFNQQYFVCVWWFNFECSDAESFYSLNSEIGKSAQSDVYGPPASVYGVPQQGGNTASGSYSAPSSGESYSSAQNGGSNGYPRVQGNGISATSYASNGQQQPSSSYGTPQRNGGYSNGNGNGNGSSRNGNGNGQRNGNGSSSRRNGASSRSRSSSNGNGYTNGVTAVSYPSATYGTPSSPGNGFGNGNGNGGYSQQSPASQYGAPQQSPSSQYGAPEQSAQNGAPSGTYGPPNGNGIGH